VRLHHLSRSRRIPVLAGVAVLAATAAALPAAAAAPSGTPATAAPAASNASAGDGFCTPVGGSRTVCPAGVPIERATFIDPTATITTPSRVRLGELVYVAPFAKLLARPKAPIQIGSASNVEDGTVLDAAARSTPARDRKIKAAGIRKERGLVIGARTVFGHHTSVRGPAVIGVGGGPIEANKDGVPEVILNQGAQVDGAWLEQNTAVSVFARVGPGVRLRSGMQVLPGKNVTTQAEADDPALGKVVPLTEADVEGTELSIDANTGFAREYSRLYRENRGLVRGISPDPGGTEYSGVRSIPVTRAKSGTCDGVPTIVPGFRSRLIGSVCTEDSVARLARVVGNEVSLRADEGTDTPYLLGRIGRMHDGVVFHDVPEAGITTGDGVVYGEDSTVHSGPGRPAVLGDEVRLGKGSVVFGSTIGNGSTIGAGALVGFTNLPAGSTVAPKSIIFGGNLFGTVEW
jgi:carbonic anhydrase/acetyltransferase-like protein (isoleucine patch superfamily)